MPSAADAQPAAASVAPHAEAPRRKLCEGQLGAPGRRLPKGTFTPVAAADATPPPASIPTGGGRWTWVNFFAAWCGPCKEEMPRLKGFQQRLASRLAVSFVSLDDDERQLRQFLGGQPAAGVRAALWLEPKPREPWLGAAGMKAAPSLPAHLLVDPAGKIRCVVDGAVDDGDFATVAAIVAER